MEDAKTALTAAISNGNGKTVGKWNKARNSRVVQLLERVRNGDKDDSPLYGLAQTIDKEWGGIDNFVKSWVEQVKAAKEGSGRGSVKALNAHKDMAKVYTGIMESFRETFDLSQFGDDDEMLNQLDMVESLVQMLTSDAWVLMDIIEAIPTFDDLVLVHILRERGYVVQGAGETVDSVESEDAS